MRDALEIYFRSFYAMQAITSGGGEPFELHSLASHSDADEMRESLKNFRALLKELPDSPF